MPFIALVWLSSDSITQDDGFGVMEDLTPGSWNLGFLISWSLQFLEKFLQLGSLKGTFLSIKRWVFVLCFLRSKFGFLPLVVNCICLLLSVFPVGNLLHLDFEFMVARFRFPRWPMLQCGVETLSFCDLSIISWSGNLGFAIWFCFSWYRFFISLHIWFLLMLGSLVLQFLSLFYFSHQIDPKNFSFPLVFEFLIYSATFWVSACG